MPCVSALDGPPRARTSTAWTRAAATSFALLVGISGSAGSAEIPRTEQERCGSLNDEGRYLESLPHCEAAVRDLRGPAGSRTQLAAALNGAGLAREMTGDRPGAKESYAEALAIYREESAPDQEALVLSNLAALAIGAGDFGGALAWLAQEEAVARAAAGAPWAQEELRYVRLNRGVALEQLGAYREALEELRTLAAVPASGGTPDAAQQASLLTNLAVLYRNLGDPRRALRLLDEAEIGHRALGDRAALANVHLNRAIVLAENLGDRPAARRELESALALARAAGDRGEELRGLQTSGELELEDGNFERARRDFRGALDVARASEARAGEWSALAALGRVEAAAGEDARALELLGEAATLLEKTSAGVEDSALGGTLLRDQRRLYATAVDLLGARSTSEATGGAGGGDAGRRTALAALAWSERLKERELLDAVAGARSTPPLDEAALAGFGGQFGPTLAYLAGERRLWLWILDADGVTLYDTGDARTILGMAADLRRALGRGEPPDVDTLNRLSSALLPKDVPAGAQLRIAPDGALHYLPFALLTDPATSSRLVEGRALAQTPSLSVLAHLDTAPRDAKWRFVGLAAPATAPVESGGSSGTGGLLAARYGLPPLPGSEREARQAASRLGGAAVVDLAGDASELRFFERAQQGTAVLHVAAHTLVDESLERGLAVFLAPDPPGRSDGLIGPEEIARARIDADLVVLSGCRTALPAVGAEDADSAASSMSSLSGSLLAAGARGVVASLWETGDTATAALMDPFYFELARGVSPAEALRRAQQRLAADPRWRAPHHWAGFVLSGDPPALRPAHGAYRRHALALLLVGAGLAVWWVGTRRRVVRKELA